MRQLRIWEWLLILLSAAAVAFLAGYFAGQQSLGQGDGAAGYAVETEHVWQPDEAANAEEAEENSTAEPAGGDQTHGGAGTAPEDEDLWNAHKLDPNTDTAENMCFFLIPWMDKELAEAIVAYRKENGNYQYLEDLLEVPGMTEELLEKMKTRIDLPSRG